MRDSIFSLLTSLRGLDPLKRLFWSELNYDRVNQTLPNRDWTEAERTSLVDAPIIIAEHGDFKIIYGQLSHELERGPQRLVINRLLQSYPYALFVFSNRTQQQWHFVNVKHDRATTSRKLFRRITIGADERLRTATDRIALLDLDSLNRSLFGIAPLAIQERHDAAFDVEAVTREFYAAYRKQFAQLKTALVAHSNNTDTAHSYALQFINRVMFVYFVQRKRWLKDQPEFLNLFWSMYQSSSHERHRFVPDWLNILFFEAFNNLFAPRQYFTADLNKMLMTAPYLNGGLFRRNKLDEEYSDFTFTDELFKSLFDTLERYNFTIREDSPLDQEVAVDPEMIGKVYESLVNVTTEGDERGDIGVFYTPRTEIDLMCRLALVDHLTQRLGAEHRNLLYEFVFAVEPDAIQHVDRELIPQDLWQQLGVAFSDLTVIDPACGSGAFLVGMLGVLDSLNERTNNQLGRDELPSERKRRIIRDSLYGVDVMDWAVDIAELRLWLQLVVETNYELAELKLRALLPDLSFKVRQGDSLVQEIAGVNLGQRSGTSEIPAAIKGRITQLKGEKLKAYNNIERSQRKFRTFEDIQQEEVSIFRELLKLRCGSLQKQIDDLNLQQDTLLGQAALPKKNAEQREQLMEELKSAQQAGDSLRSARDVPFVWDVAFVEIFEGERQGFDLVIGNPPYVRQERIEDQLIQREPRIGKAQYKTKLLQSVYARYPRYFGRNQRTGKTNRTLDKKNDLYIYFFFHALGLLNPQGSFCFVTSNSWLDVGYGAELQEFLLRQSQVRLMIDNKSRRTFANAAVNSVIALLGAVQTKPDAGLAKTARFVQFAVPFEAALDAGVWQHIENAQERTTTLDFRVMPVPQQVLLDDGIPTTALAADDAEEPLKPGQYAGNKWGGKYLRAPDIYYTLLDKGRDKLVRLGDIARIRRGFTTGANEFFYLDDQTIARWSIEPAYIAPAIKSPRETQRITLDAQQFTTKLLMCHQSRDELAGTGALAYIEWGERQGYHQRPSCRSRPRWWDLGTRTGAHVNCNYLVDRVMRFFGSPQPFFVSDNFQEIHTHHAWEMMVVATNSTITQLMVNIFGRTNFGDGLLKIQTYEVADLLVLSPHFIGLGDAQNVVAQAQRLHLDGADRHHLDLPVFDALNLTQDERDGVYAALNGLVEGRLKKAASFKIVKEVEV